MLVKPNLEHCVGIEPTYTQVCNQTMLQGDSHSPIPSLRKVTATGNTATLTLTNHKDRARVLHRTIIRSLTLRIATNEVNNLIMENLIVLRLHVQTPEHLPSNIGSVQPGSQELIKESVNGRPNGCHLSLPLSLISDQIRCELLNSTILINGTIREADNIAGKVDVHN